MFGFFRGRRGARLREVALPLEWVSWLESSVPMAALLDADETRRWHGLIQLFLAETRFVGCRGLLVTDRMRVIVAGQACLLLVNLAEVPYPGLSSVLLYPSQFGSYHTGEHPDGTVSGDEEWRLGESAERDVIVLSWSDIESALAGRSAIQLVWHECAHQIDARSGDLDGLPPLPAEGIPEFRGRIDRAFERFETAANAGRKTLLDPYGATDRCEFFAVAVETLFARPVAMRRAHRDLYDLLATYFRLDLAARLDART